MSSRATAIVAHTRGELRIIRSDGESAGRAACITCEHFQPRSAACGLGILKNCYPLWDSVCQRWAENGCPLEQAACAICGRKTVQLPAREPMICSRSCEITELLRRAADGTQGSSP